MCWPKLGYRKACMFHGDIPALLMHDGNGHPTCGSFQYPLPPKVFAVRLSKLLPSARPGPSLLTANLQTLAHLLN